MEGNNEMNFNLIAGVVYVWISGFLFGVTIGFVGGFIKRRI